MEYIIIGVLLLVLAETSYLTYHATRKNHRMGQNPVFVDTSVLIDGRIVSVMESGFVTRPLYIPRSVVGELQFLADNADSEKRSRARHGLDVITQLQAIQMATVTIFTDSVRAKEGVDNRLLELAKKHNGAICTIDYNLNKVAVVEGIEVLNVNELAKTLRMAYLPGERMFIELSQKGNDSHQGVGHLEDGTMVVVEHAYKQIGSKVEVEFIRSLQTAAGKMMFAKLVTQAPAKKSSSVRETSAKAIVGRKARQPQAKKVERAESVVQNEQVKPAAQSQKPRQPRKPVQEQTHAESKVPQQDKPQKQSQPKSQRPQRRRRSPEDSMVELANKS